MITPPVRIRMYKQGLGDCFLITFIRSDGSNYYVLIDCGAVTGSDPTKVVAAAQDVFNTTHGHLDLLVGTHEHWDHLSGFNQARSIFDQFSISNVWLAWTEELANPTAQNLVKKRSAKVAALRDAVTHMNAAAADPGLIKSIQQVLSFFGEDDGASANPGVADSAAIHAAAIPGAAIPGAAGRSLSTTSEAMNYLRTRRDAKTHYCNPDLDQPLPLEGVEGVRAYVFGPPTDPTLLKQDLPSKSGQETYGITSKCAEDSFFAALGSIKSLGAAAPGDEQFQPLAYPFDDFYRVSLAEAQSSPDDFFRDRYGFVPNKANDWRRIDTDWLNLTSELALNLDSDTNNTSLVLAFELGDPGQGRVLLFAADAQVGNWLSWGPRHWAVPVPGQPDRTVTAPDLLRRTVLYKVGHHGSHNATLAAQGLELMTNDALVAMLPVIKDMAANKGWDAMPFDPLLDHLKNHARGRVMRIDTGLPQRADAPQLTDAEWQAFIDCTTVTDLYIEFTL